MKLISDSYLYKVADYGSTIYTYLMSSERVDKNANGFADIVYAIKQQANSIILKVLLSDKVVLLINPKGGISRAFKVIYAKDLKDNKDRKKVFIDCTSIITFNNGVYTCKKIGTLISYLTAAMTYIIYYNLPKAITSNTVICKYGSNAFIDMMLYVFGYLKMPITYADNKERMGFVLSEYYQTCIMEIPFGESTYNMAKTSSGLKDKKVCDYLHTTFGLIFNQECDFNIFLKKFAEVFLNQKEDSDSDRKLTVDAFAQRWMYAFGPGTFLGLECFVPFSQILTDCYTGSFINQQNTIEKVVGSKTVVAFSNELLKIGSENA